MSEWKEYKLGNLITLEYGKGLKDYRNGIGNYDVYGTNGKIGLTNEFLYSKPSVIIGRKGAYRGVHLATPPFFVIDTAFYSILKNPFLDNNFLYYWLKNININEMDCGSAIPSTSRYEIYDLDILLPTLPEQKAIASVLSSLDDKIDLLHRQNKTLENIAETIFRQWFVEEAGDDWDVKRISDVAEHIRINVNPTANPNINYYHYSIPAFDEGRVPKKEIGSEILSTKYKIIPNTILVSKLNPIFPRIWAIGEEISPYSICSTEFQICKPIRKHYYSYLFFLFKSDEIRIEMEMAASGTSGSHQRVRPEEIFNINLHFPPEKKLKEFSNITLPLLDKIKKNRIQINILEKLRNTLLPKLMSGEIRMRF